MKRVTLAALEGFIQHALRKKLCTDMRTHKIFKEADLECCLYFHLRRFIGTDRRWFVFAHKHSFHTRFYTDLTIYKRHEPKVAIEIKWRKKKLPTKDRNSLNAALKVQHVGKAYFFSAVPSGIYSSLPKKTKLERHRLVEFVVHLGHENKSEMQKVEEWEQERLRFRAKTST